MTVGMVIDQVFERHNLMQREENQDHRENLLRKMLPKVQERYAKGKMPQRQYDDFMKAIEEIR